MSFRVAIYPEHGADGNPLIQCADLAMYAAKQSYGGYAVYDTSLHDMGIHLSIDDYGTGYSSLAYLRRLPVNELKIDQSFATGMTHDESNAVVVQSTIDLGHNLGLRVAAEGVENLGILEMLKELGCNAAPGCYLSQPLPANQLERRFRRTRPGDPFAAANK